MRAIIIPTILVSAAVVPLQAQRSNCETIPEEAAETARLGQAALDSSRAMQEIRQLLENDLREAARQAGIARPRGIVMAHLGGAGAPRVWSYRSNVPDTLSLTVVARHTEALARWSRRDGVVNLRLDRRPVPENAARRCSRRWWTPMTFRVS